MATDSSILAWRFPGTEKPRGLSPWVCKESDMTERLSLYWVLPRPHISHSQSQETSSTIHTQKSALDVQGRMMLTNARLPWSFQ